MLVVPMCVDFFAAGVSVPYLTGQWLQRWPPHGLWPWGRCFSPLSHGSVVATRQVRGGPLGLPEFQSPISRVSGCNSPAFCARSSQPGVSVPYLTGQWLQPRQDESWRGFFFVSVPYLTGQWLQQPPEGGLGMRIKTALASPPFVLGRPHFSKEPVLLKNPPLLRKGFERPPS